MRLNSDMTMCALFLLSCKLVAIMTQDIEKRDLTHERNDFIGKENDCRELSCCVCCLSMFNVAFNNFSVIPRPCPVATGSSMLIFIVLPH